jgi:hypothetical protein
LVGALPCAAWVKELKGTNTDPKPAAQAVLIRSLLDKFPFLPGMP